MRRRLLLKAAASVATTIALAACGKKSAGASVPTLPPLKSLAPYPLGVCGMTAQLADADWTHLVAQQFSSFSPEWELKMEYVLGEDGRVRLDRMQRLAELARTSGMSLHGHALIWYAQDGAYFQRLSRDPDAFIAALADYIASVIRPYATTARGWDVVNEPLKDDGSGLRPCLWAQVLGEDYIGLSLQAAHEAAPNAVHFINDYNLEYYPAKRRALLSLCERLLRAGAPLSGIGSQTHIDAAIAPGALRDCIRDLGSLGLKLHISELDISFQTEGGSLNAAEKRLGQKRILEEIVTAYDALPASQQYGMTIWAARDKDSWLNRPKGSGKHDEPVLFDNAGAPKPLAYVLADLWR